MIRHCILLLISILVCIRSAPGQDEIESYNDSSVKKHTDEKLKDRLENIVAGLDGRIGVYVHHLSNGEAVTINEDNLFPTASLVKVPVLLSVFAHIEEDTLKYTDEIVLHDSLRTPGSGLLTSFKPGARIRVSEAIMLMLTVSDNTAAHWLEDLMGGPAVVNDWLEAQGFKKTRINSGVEGREDAGERYGWGQSTPREMAAMLIRIRNGNIVSRAASEEMYRELTRSYWDGGALSQIPPWVEVASKQGWVPRSRSEVLLVNAPHGDYVVCVMTADQKDTRFVYDNTGFNAIRQVSRAVWEHFEPQSKWQVPKGADNYNLVPSEEAPGDETWWEIY